MRSRPNTHSGTVNIFIFGYFSRILQTYVFFLVFQRGKEHLPTQTPEQGAVISVPRAPACLPALPAAQRLPCVRGKFPRTLGTGGGQGWGSPL